MCPATTRRRWAFHETSPAICKAPITTCTMPMLCGRTPRTSHARRHVSGKSLMCCRLMACSTPQRWPSAAGRNCPCSSCGSTRISIPPLVCMPPVSRNCNTAATSGTKAPLLSSPMQLRCQTTSTACMNKGGSVCSI